MSRRWSKEHWKPLGNSQELVDYESIWGDTGPMRPIGLLYDHLTPNFGDCAIGTVLMETLVAAGLPHEVVRTCSLIDSRFSALIVGAGHCLRVPGDPNYDRFRVPGRHVLNAVGISREAGSLEFLADYRYVSVRSSADYERVSAIRPDAAIVPCPSLLLEGTHKPELPVEDRTILIHMPPSCSGFVPRWPEAVEEAFPDYHKALLSLNRFNNDQEYLYDIAFYKRWQLIPGLTPTEIDGLLGHPNVHGLLSASLHATMFAYKHAKPFLALTQVEKIRSFVNDRGLSDRSWTHQMDPRAMRNALGPMVRNTRLESLWELDKVLLKSHMNRLVSECCAAVEE